MEDITKSKTREIIDDFAMFHVDYTDVKIEKQCFQCY